MEIRDKKNLIGKLMTDTTRLDRTGHDTTRQDTTGQDRTGQDRTGQDRTIQIMGPDRNDFIVVIRGDVLCFY